MEEISSDTCDMLCTILREAGFMVYYLNPIIHISLKGAWTYMAPVAFDLRPNMLWRRCFSVYYADPDMFDKLKERLMICNKTICDKCEHYV